MTGKSKTTERKEILKAYIGSEVVVKTVLGDIITGILVDYDALVIKLRVEKTIYLIPFQSIEKIIYFIKEDKISEVKVKK